jgi:hypothetical protein
MGKETTSKTIDGEEYTFHQLGAVKSNKLLWRLKRIVGPSLAALLNGAEKDKGKGKGLESILNSKVDFEEILNGFYERATEAEVEYVTSTLLSQVMHSGDGALDDNGKIDKHFTGALSRMYKVLWEALKHEYSDFLGESGIVANLSKSVQAGNPKK